eukprot:1090640-Rhodomonas_salina.4
MHETTRRQLTLHLDGHERGRLRLADGVKHFGAGCSGRTQQLGYFGNTRRDFARKPLKCLPPALINPIKSCQAGHKPEPEVTVTASSYFRAAPRRPSSCCQVLVVLVTVEVVVKNSSSSSSSSSTSLRLSRSLALSFSETRSLIASCQECLVTVTGIITSHRDCHNH